MALRPAALPISSSFPRVFGPVSVSSQVRFQSSASLTRGPPRDHPKSGEAFASSTKSEEKVSPLTRLSTRSIVRSVVLGTFFTSPWLFRPGFAVFKFIANSKSAWWNPDSNPLLRGVIRPVVYDHFCAGRNKAEICRTSAEIRRLGFSGVVLCYGKEVQIGADKSFLGYDKSQATALDVEVERWKHGNIETLDMVGQGDWLGIKCTGAGLHVTDALVNGQDPPPKYVEAMDEICRHALARGCRVWIDAEQQAVQPTIDRWTYDLMRRFNKPGRQALVYTTVQAYLRSSRDKLQHQLQLARKEGWRLAVKLVRGAYIANDRRGLIHDTQADTDASYNGIVNDCLRGTLAELADPHRAPEFDLLLAGHNSHTIRTAAKLAADLAAASQLKVVPEFAQLQGMADDIGCELLRVRDDVEETVAGRATRTGAGDPSYRPSVYKCLTWGSLQECMQYLTRRLVENQGAGTRMVEGNARFRKELGRRLRSSIGMRA